MGFGESSVGDELPGFSVDEQNSENSTPWKRSSLSISESSDVNTDYTALWIPLFFLLTNYFSYFNEIDPAVNTL